MRDDIKKLNIVYSEALAQNGVSPQGILWPNAHDLAKRFEIFLEPIIQLVSERKTKVKILDYGCGPGFLLDILKYKDLLECIEYTGIDTNSLIVDAATKRWPGIDFRVQDARDQQFNNQRFDFAILSGVFTARFNNSFDEMKSMAEETLVSIWPYIDEALLFNTMSKHVDWERDDLFHWPLDDIMAFCKLRLSRHVQLRLDYGLWEATAIVRRRPVQLDIHVPDEWETGAR